jgi:hypothetical protein
VRVQYQPRLRTSWPARALQDGHRPS